MSKIKLSKEFIKNTVKLALNEDLYPSGDITSNLIKDDQIVMVKLIANQSAIVGGLLFAKQAFAFIDDKIKFIIQKKDGSKVKAGEILAEWDPYTRPIITEKEGFVEFVDVNKAVSYTHLTLPTILRV